MYKNKYIVKSIDLVDLFIQAWYNKITIKKERFKIMTREQAKQKLDENCKKARELNMDAITFFATDMITHEIYSFTGFFVSSVALIVLGESVQP